MQEWKVNDIMQDNRVFSGEGVRVHNTKKMWPELLGALFFVLFCSCFFMTCVVSSICLYMQSE